MATSSLVEEPVGVEVEIWGTMGSRGGRREGEGKRMKEGKERERERGGEEGVRQKKKGTFRSG